MTLTELYKELERHDWFHAMSDDQSVYNRGQRNWIKLYQESKTIDGGRQLFRDYSKHVCSGPAFDTVKEPKPEMPKEQPVYVERIE